MAQPNILLILTDQQRPDSCGCYGQKLPVTPNLDALAATGLRCTRAFTPNPVCGPARAALQSGCYPTATGNHDNNTRLPADCQSLAGVLSEAGYFCGYVGKWHLASDKDANFRTTAIPADRRGGYRDAWVAADSLEWTSHGYGGHVFGQEGQALVFDNYTWRGDFLTDQLLDTLDQAHSDARPFFIMASYLEPHQQNNRGGCEPPHGRSQAFAEATIPGDLKDLAGDWPEEYPKYLACCEGIDRNLGRVIDHLKERQLFENTLIIFSSDHGCHFKTRNREYKRSCHDASIQVPMVLHGPGFTPDAADLEYAKISAERKGEEVFDGFVNLIDIPATIVTAAGRRPPKHWQGRPLQERQQADWRQEHYIQLSGEQIGRAIRTSQWTYSVRVPGRPEKPRPSRADVYVEDLLYDNRADPYQQHNVICQPGYAQIRQELREQLVAAMIAVGEAPSRIIAPQGPGPQPQLGCAAANM